MKERIFYRIFVLFGIMVLMGCGSSESPGTRGADSENTQEVPADSYDDLYKSILEAENISVDEAYEQLKDSASDDPGMTAFVQKLKDLKDCSGKFANTTKSGNRYSAEVSFYLSSGQFYNTTSYSGYRGEIKDGAVTETDESGYLFESEPKGDLYGNEQDFHLYFSKEQLHIMWADTCDYVLDRGDGSVESVEDYKVPFEESATYKKIEELLDNNFSDYEHDMVFDKEKRELNIYFQAPDNLRAALDRRESGLLDAWQKVVDSMTDFSEKLQTIIQIGGKAEDANIYWVDKLRSGHDYTESDYLVWVRNGTVIYNYADQSPQSSMSSGESKETDDHSADVSNDQDSGREPATFGEKNALEKALQYLKYSAFSYTGLIEQLEFEGFSHAEAVYAVDNCGADWNEQAVKKAKQYLDYSSFSRSELVDQLEFEGFTNSQAEYAVSKFY